MSCEDIPSLLDLQKVKKHADDFGRLMGTGTGTSTNEVTGQVRPTYNKVIEDLGFKPGSGDFTTGFTVMPGERDVAWYDQVSKNWYSYLGVIPIEGYVVPRTTNPVSSSLWKPVTDQTLRKELASTHGASLSGTTSGGTVQESIDGILSLIPSSVSAHNQDAAAHPQLSSFITAEANRAKQAADAASLSGAVYPDTASGLDSTTNGKYFSVVSPIDHNYLDLYRNVSGVATYQKSYPSTALVERLDNGFNKLTGNSGFSVDGSDGQSFIEVNNGDAKALVVGTHSTEMLVFDTISKKVNVPASDLSDATVSKVIHLSDSEETESENTEDLITSTRAKTIGSGKHSLTFDTVNGELISTFKIVDKSQNGGVIFDTDVPDIIAGVPPGYEFATRVYQATPTIARTGSRFWLSWRADDQNGEFPDNYFVIGYSDDNCKTVTESHILKFSNAQHQLLDPVLWTNPETWELWLFWCSHGKGVHTDGVGGCWCSVLENPEAPRGFSWSTPYKYRNVGQPRVPVRVAGRWMQCVDLWDAGVASLYPNETGCTFVEFDPRTKSTVNIGHNTPNRGTRYSGFFESELIQLTNGRLMSLTRSYNSSVETTRSFSIDGGKTWSAQETYTALGETTSSRMWMGRTPAGRLMVVYNNHKSRKNMVVKLSEDDGETFPYSVVLEGPASPQNTSYPIATFDGDDIYVIYDYGRQVANEIRVTIVKETEIVAGTSVPDINIVSGPTIAY